MRLCLLARPFPPEQEGENSKTRGGGRGEMWSGIWGLDFRPSGVS